MGAHGAFEWFESQGVEEQHVHEKGGDGTDSKRGNGAGLGSADDKAVRDILYHVENLRKRPGAED